jgi:dipeptidase E
MSLVPFHFFPHYRESRRYKAALISESIRLRRPIYAAKDGSGIITNSDQISFLGRTVVYFNGNSLPLSVKL